MSNVLVDWIIGCKETCLCAALFSPESKNKIDEIIKEQGLERVKTEVMLVLEKVSRKSDDEVQVAAQILLKLKEGNQQWNDMGLLLGFQKKNNLWLGLPFK